MDAFSTASLILFVRKEESASDRNLNVQPNAESSVSPPTEYSGKVVSAEELTSNDVACTSIMSEIDNSAQFVPEMASLKSQLLSERVSIPTPH